jgi:hypothetical protein
MQWSRPETAGIFTLEHYLCKSRPRWHWKIWRWQLYQAISTFTDEHWIFDIHLELSWMSHQNTWFAI